MKSFKQSKTTGGVVAPAADINVFSNEEFGSVRVIQIDNEPWFVGKDVCTLFGDSNHNRSLGRVDADDKLVYTIRDSLGRSQPATLINESGLYSLLFSMQPQKGHRGEVPEVYPIETQERIEKVHRFKRWVTSEVLPSIRKTGTYSCAVSTSECTLPMNYKEALMQLVAQVEVNEQLAAEIENMKPKVTYYDVVLQTPDVVPISVIAKDYGQSARWLNSWLHLKGIQYRQGTRWLLYQQYADCGYVSSKTSTYCSGDGTEHSAVSTQWTQKGRRFIYEMLKKDEILPLIECA